VLDRTATSALASVIATQPDFDLEDDFEGLTAAAPSAANAATAAGRIARPFRSAWQFVKTHSLSSLTRRIVITNLVALLVLALGILYLSQFKAGLIDARVHSLRIQGEIVAGAIASQASAEPADALLRRLVAPTQTRARVYNNSGELLLDTLPISADARLAAEDYVKGPQFLGQIVISIQKMVSRRELPHYVELGPREGRKYPEVALALSGQEATFVRANEKLEAIVSVAIPIQRQGAPMTERKALLLSTQGSDIDAMVRAEREAVAKVFGLAMAVMIALSLWLARSIGDPVRRLAAAAKRVRKRIRMRVEIPDFTRRHDEIGDLSGALRDMTDSLYNRIEGIERFAADVAHELKNPLTSLRSAVETMPLAKTDVSRTRLLEVIQHDVRRLDRLISDISDASRLDAELQRQDAAPVNLVTLLETIVEVANQVRGDNDVAVKLAFRGKDRRLIVPGNDSRLGQVINNLVDNAKSFSPEGGTVRVTALRAGSEVLIVIDDDGPGVPEDAMEKIFLRFYTDRPDHGFGNNSGLGLSISKQIVEAHGGRIIVSNRHGHASGDERTPLGARFQVRLPAA
jgi:two-component system sensor histidine kinase ChvG